MLFWPLVNWQQQDDFMFVFNSKTAEPVQFIVRRLYQVSWSHKASPYWMNNLLFLWCVCRFVSDWVYSGVFRDVYKEFMIQVNEDYLSYRGEYVSKECLNIDRVYSQGQNYFLPEIFYYNYKCFGLPMFMFFLCSGSKKQRNGQIWHHFTQNMVQTKVLAPFQNCG